MQLEEYFDLSNPEEIRIQGHRIWIEHILYPFIYQERTAEEIHNELPTLTLEQVYATILYYLHNKEAVNQYMANWLGYCRRSEEQNRRENAPFYEKLKKRKEEWLAKKGEQVEK